jgi:hypothetical protein
LCDMVHQWLRCRGCNTVLTAAQLTVHQKTECSLRIVTISSHYTTLTLHCTHTTLLSRSTALSLHCTHTTLLSRSTALSLHCSHTTLLSHYAVLTTLLHCPLTILLSHCMLLSRYHICWPLTLYVAFTLSHYSSHTVDLPCSRFFACRSAASLAVEYPRCVLMQCHSTRLIIVLADLCGAGAAYIPPNIG